MRRSISLASPFVVQDRLSDWPRGSSPRRAGVSALGVGGTNAHVVLEEPPAVTTNQPSRTSQLLVLSAKTPSALNAASENLAHFLEESPEVSLADAAFTLQMGRRAFVHRRAVVADTPSEAISALRGSREGKTAIENRPVVFLFPGQGAQRVGMGLGPYETEPIFREALDRCSEILREPLRLDLRDVLYAKDDSTAIERLNQTAVAQPALFAVEYALARALAQLGHQRVRVFWA